MNNRRKLMVALGAIALAAPFGSFAQQQGKVWRIGFLGGGSPKSDASRLDALRAGLKELGYAEGNNVIFEARFAEGSYDRCAMLAADLVQLKVDVIVTASSVATSAAQAATRIIPIVLASGELPGNAAVGSLAHPGGNLTGFSNMSVDVAAKRVELLASAVPKVVRLAWLVNPKNTANLNALQYVKAAAQTIRVGLLPIETSTEAEVADGFMVMVRQKAGALGVSVDPFLRGQMALIADLALRHKLPTVFGYQQGAEVGGLLSYGTDPLALYRRAATYVAKILKGAKPGDLPIERPTKFELAINMNTARALGIKIPNTILLQATKVIE